MPGVNSIRAAGECVCVAVTAVTVTAAGMGSFPGRTHAKARTNATVATASGWMIGRTDDARTVAQLELRICECP